MNNTKNATKPNSKRRSRFILSLVLASLVASGCAQFMAFNQPAPFTPVSLNPGVKRMHVIAELGQPVDTETQTNLLTDNYKYVDGGAKNNGVSKTCRVVIYTAGDLFTLFLDQIVWMPSEKFGFAGTYHSVIIEYTNAPDGTWHASTIQNSVVNDNSENKK
jgi:hypothetical protein